MTGLTLDGNGSFLQAYVLEHLGLRISRATTVGDEKEEITKALLEISARADVLVVSGGLGPTADDLTAECAAQAAQLPMVLSAEILQSLEARARRLGFRLTEGAQKQALIPQGARYVLGTLGSAPMLQLRIADCEVFLLPGIPHEFRAFVEENLLGFLEARCLPQEGRLFRKLRRLQCMGLPESLVDEAMAPVAASFPEVKVGFRARMPGVEVKLLCEAKTPKALAKLEEAVLAKTYQALGPVVFGEGELSIGECLTGLLLERGQTLGVAESCTGGHIAAALTAKAGASRCFLGSAVVYSGKAKHLWAKVPKEALEAHGEVSAEAARLLAQGARHTLGADWGLSAVGYAGPTGEAGLFFLACAGPHGFLREARAFWPSERKAFQAMVAARALHLLRSCLLGSEG